MEKLFERPLSFGEILDVSFRIIKDYFLKLFPILLILLGPAYLLQGIGMLAAGVSLLSGPSGGTGIGRWLQPGMQDVYKQLTASQPLFFYGCLLLLIVLFPVASASLILATDKIRKNEALDVPALIKQAFFRFWAMLGSGLIYGLIVFALFFGWFIIMFVYLIISAGMSAFRGLPAGIPPPGLGVHISVVVILSILAFAAYLYLMTRWSFFFPAIVLEKVSPGLGKSWRLTRGRFWRLIGLYLVVTIIVMIISYVSKFIIGIIIGGSVLEYLLSSVITLIATLIGTVAYAVVYLDLRVRNEGMDLRALINVYHAETSGPEKRSAPVPPAGEAAPAQPGKTEE